MLDAEFALRHAAPGPSHAFSQGGVRQKRVYRGCQGCGGARMTLRNGVERAIRERVPEVGAITDVTDHAAGGTIARRWEPTRRGT